MIIFDEPFVSEVLLKTAKDKGYAVLDNSMARSLDTAGLNLLSDEQFKAEFGRTQKLYTNSENAISWINANLDDYDIVEKTDLFKNKVKFRDLLSGMYPDFYYKEVLFEDIAHISAKELRFPFVIKPAVGFFSLGVYYVEDEAAWKTIRPRIIEETEKIKDYYPDDVLNSHGFIIEQVIEGTEYAVDAYYDAEGNPVILDVLKHYFAGADDVSDRVYMTSVKIVREMSPKIKKFLESLGRLTLLKNYPFHIELRVDKNGHINPIEVNPLRFAGWCCTDVAWFGYGLNTYQYFQDNISPDWDAIEKKVGDKVFSLIVVEKSAKIDDTNLKGFDYDKLVKSFSKVLEIRKTDYMKYGVFCFMFAETDREDAPELKAILNSDLHEYLING